MNCDILIIGGEGDLSFRKLYPALYHLDMSGCLLDGLKVVAIARNKALEGAFPEKVREKFSEYNTQETIDETVWARFAKRLQYFAVDATLENELGILKKKVFTDSSRDLLVYLATPPSIFAPVCQSLWAVGLVRPNTRIVVEKPLGENRESFLSINESLTAIFPEQQVFRIDHYLGKETVQNLLAMRFANTLFEPLWNNNYIDHIQITVAETVGIEGRWEFYDEAGAVRDMVQNHLLQLLCLVAMEPPAKLDARAVHDEKLKVLRSLQPLSPRDVREFTVRGQYASGAVNGKVVPGYLEEEGAARDSTTETFVAIKAAVNNWRWAGVPFYLRTGKRMLKRFAEIVIEFNQVPFSLFSDNVEATTPNRLVIRLQPQEGIRLHLLNKVPGLDETMPLESVSLNLSFSEAFSDVRVPDGYERLLYDAMRGNSTLFMQSDQLEAAWLWVDNIIKGWRSTHQRVVPYTAGSWGPSESIALIAKDGRSWYE